MIFDQTFEHGVKSGGLQSSVLAAEDISRVWITTLILRITTPYPILPMLPVGHFWRSSDCADLCKIFINWENFAKAVFSAKHISSLGEFCNRLFFAKAGERAAMTSRLPIIQSPAKVCTNLTLSTLQIPKNPSFAKLCTILTLCRNHFYFTPSFFFFC